MFLGQRTVSGEYLVGSEEGIFRPRTVHRVLLEKLWQENLSFVTGLLWKHNAQHEEGDEVLLDAQPPAPSDGPAATPLPPASAADPEVRKFHVKTKDLDPASGGIGFTGGCPGCKAFVLGMTRAVP